MNTLTSQRPEIATDMPATRQYDHEGMPSADWLHVRDAASFAVGTVA